MVSKNPPRIPAKKPSKGSPYKRTPSKAAVARKEHEIVTRRLQAQGVERRLDLMERARQIEESQLPEALARIEALDRKRAQAIAREQAAARRNEISDLQKRIARLREQPDAVDKVAALQRQLRELKKKKH